MARAHSFIVVGVLTCVVQLGCGHAPEVALSSPKLKKPRTTAWFASSVKARYQACRARLP